MEAMQASSPGTVSRASSSGRAASIKPMPRSSTSIATRSFQQNRFIGNFFYSSNKNMFQVMNEQLFPLAREVAYLDTAAEGLPPLACEAALTAYWREKSRGTPGRARLF